MKTVNKANLLFYIEIGIKYIFSFLFNSTYNK